MSHTVGIDIGGTKTSAGLVGPDGRMLARREAPTPAADGAAAVVRRAIDLAGAVIADADVPPVAVGVGSAGVIDAPNRRVVSATDSLPGWAGTELGRLIEDALGLPVVVENDVHAHAIGEARFGAGRGCSTVLLVAAGTGVGGALVSDGALLRGAGHVAGHYGHMPSVEAQGIPCTCGRVGHLEAIAAGPAILAAYRRGGGDAADTREVFARAEAGDGLATATIRVAGTALGRSIGGLINALDPDIVVVGGGLAQTSELWWGPLRAGVDAETIPAASGRSVVAAALGSDAAIIGAAAAAEQREGAAA